MSKITVSKKQMEEVMKYKGIRGLSLSDMLYHAGSKNFCGGSKIINGMTLEKIVLAWHGYAEIEKEYATFDEAMKAHDNGDLVSFHHDGNSKITESHQRKLKDSWLGNFSLDEFRKGKWSIKGGNL